MRLLFFVSLLLVRFWIASLIRCSSYGPTMMMTMASSTNVGTTRRHKSSNRTKRFGGGGDGAGEQRRREQELRGKNNNGESEKGGNRKKMMMMMRRRRRPRPVIFDTDYGPFIDDVFGLGLIVNSGDFLDVKYVLTTSEDVELSAKCVAKHLDRAGRGTGGANNTTGNDSSIPVGAGTPFPPEELRGGVCAVPGLVGFALEEECRREEDNIVGDDLPFSDDGVGDVARLLLESNRNNWWYIVVGGQTSLRTLIEEYPSAAARIHTLVVMAGNWCADFFPFPEVLAPTGETNVGCDPAAANVVLDGNVSPIRNVVYVPVVVADEIGGADYAKFVRAATSGADPGAAATLDFYRAWSAAGRADPNLLVHLEALAYDPETESTPQFDPCAIMIAIEMLDKRCDDRVSLFEVDAGVHFLEAGEGLNFPDSPRAAFSLLPEGFRIDNLPEQCPSLTEFTFNPNDTPEMEKKIKVALGYKSERAKASFYAEMAARMAGERITGCTWSENDKDEGGYY